MLLPQSLHSTESPQSQESYIPDNNDTALVNLPQDWCTYCIATLVYPRLSETPANICCRLEPGSNACQRCFEHGRDCIYPPLSLSAISYDIAESVLSQDEELLSEYRVTLDTLLNQAEDKSNEKNTLILCYKDPTDLSRPLEQDEVGREPQYIEADGQAGSDMELRAVRSYFGLDVNPLGADDDSCLFAYLYQSEDLYLEES
ncbi:uncharacterized protein FFFS_16037 [Fusarium fujikuroi]|nr:uncharacterized protein FFFS_16037 [Fusarium fujikuroi]